MFGEFEKVFNGIHPMAGAAAVGVVVAFWSRIKQFFSRMMTHLVDVVKVDGDLAAEMMTRISGTGRVSRFGGRGYLVLNRYVRTERAQRWVLTRWLSKDSILTFWIKHQHLGIRVPLWVDRGQNGEQMTFRFLRGTIDFEQELKDIVAKVNARRAGRFRVIRVVGGGKDENGRNATATTESGFTQLPATAFYLDVDPSQIGTPLHQGGPEDLWWGPDTNPILEDVRLWNGRRGWYQERRIPWRRGYLLHGRPGTGKTSIARAIAIDLDFPIYSLDLGSMTNQHLEQVWQSIRVSSPCMVLIEDIDSVYQGRVPLNLNPHQGTPPTFDCLLNCLDGADPNDGVVTIISTNNLTAVDEALSGLCGADGKVLETPQHRPGRVDRVVKLPDRISEEGRRLLAARTLHERPDLVEEVVREGEEDTPAVFVERTIRAAQTRVVV